MKAKEIQDLIDFIAKSNLDEVNIETEQFKLNVKRSSASRPADQHAQPMLPPALPPAFAPPALPPAATAPQPPPAAVTAPTPAAPAASNHYTLKSPMIGTFYRSANPESPVFVNVGDEVKKGQTLCIIEAMKLFNEIESEVSGRVVKVLVDNASPVEYDQPLFLIDPS
ncbi:MAG: acetyl-CoA carboxylase biotin carboxyl carrier protein [Cytophagales bacterium]|nr:acetyl-CoA carboxylase biotin carboxyl carrier protein [Cytophagales bacterium]